MTWKRSTKGPLEVLEISKLNLSKLKDTKARLSAVKQNYYRLSHLYHPDHLQNVKEGQRKEMAEKYLLIKDAYNYLKGVCLLFSCFYIPI